MKNSLARLCVLCAAGCVALVPTSHPSAVPTSVPTSVPSVPTSVPSAVPTAVPTAAPSAAPSITAAPTARVFEAKKKKKRSAARSGWWYGWWNDARPSHAFGRRDAVIAWVAIWCCVACLAFSCVAAACAVAARRRLSDADAASSLDAPTCAACCTAVTVCCAVVGALCGAAGASCGHATRRCGDAGSTCCSDCADAAGEGRAVAAAAVAALCCCCCYRRATVDPGKVDPLELDSREGYRKARSSRVPRQRSLFLLPQRRARDASSSSEARERPCARHRPRRR